MKLQNSMHELLDELTTDTRRSLLGAKYKIMSCVLLSDRLLDKGSINENARVYKTDANVSRNMHHNDTSIENDEIGMFDQIDEFVMRDMVFDKKFSTLNTALQYIQDAKIWSFVSTARIENTNITMNYYRCNLISDIGVLCPAKKCLLSDLSNSALFYRSAVRHNHDSTDQMFIKGICDELPEDGDKKCMFSFDMIAKCIPAFAQLPNGYHNVYCVDYLIDRDLKILRCFLSTRQLLKSALGSRSIHVSSVETIHWKKFEIILVGTTDLEENFHHFGLAICSAKTASDYEFIFSSIQKGVTECYPDCNLTIDTLLSDWNPAVQNAFKYVFGLTSKTVTCLLNFQTHISKLFKNKNSIIDDIYKLQMLGSADLFNIGVQLFLKKWGQENLEQFKTQWLDENCNWYEGYSYFIPSFNTALQNEYELFRKSYLDVPLKTFDLFMNQLVVVLNDWSSSYINNYKFAKEFHIPDHILQAACRWLRLPKNIEKEKIDSDTFYYLNVDNRSSKDLLKTYCGQEFNSFDQFIAVRSKYCTVRKNQRNVLICDCKIFYKHFFCHHTTGVGFLLNLYKIPLALIPDPTAIPYYLRLD